jgi:hypothetical protein
VVKLKYLRVRISLSIVQYLEMRLVAFVVSDSNYFYYLFCSEGRGKLTVFSVKAMLATMCGGKMLDKLRCKYFHII